MAEENANVTDEELDAAFGMVDDGAGAEGGDDGDADGDGDADTGTDQGDAGGDADAAAAGTDGDAGRDWKKEFGDFKADAGRKQKGLEKTVETLTKSVSDLLTVIKSGGIGQQQQAEEDPFDPDDPIPLTMGGLLESVKTFMSKEKKTDAKQSNAYQDSYLNTVSNLGGDYPENVHQHIVDRMFKEFNIRHSDNPALDAQLNFRNAEAAILREVRTRKANPLDKNKGKQNQNLGGSNNTQQGINADAPVKLDSYAQEFIKATGMKEEDAQKALTGELPMYLRGKVRV